jgi:PAS domain S-box-containing protein
MCTAEGKGFHYSVDSAGVWVECVRERRPVIHNDYARLPHRKGMPPGHAPVLRELVVPVFRGERIVAILGVGNKPCDYSEKDVEMVSQLANLAWDIVLRTRAEEALRESEERFRTVADFTYDWEYWIGVDEKHLYVSPSCERVTGYRPDEFMQNGALLKRITHPDDLPALQGHLQQELECDEALSLDFRITTRSGEQRWVGHKCRQVRSPDGGLLGRRGSNRDITERKQAEERQEELIRALEAANRELDEFAHIVSHDVKAPLRAINSLAAWLIADYADKLDTRGKEHLDMLMRKVKHLYSLIDGILQYSKAGKTRETLTEVDVTSLVSHVVGMLAPPPNVMVVINHMPTVVCEKTRLAQIFQNLLSNAFQFNDKPDGRIEVSCHPSPDGCFWTFSVKDNGPGIEERHFDRIFLPFQTLTHRPGSESTGIGLALVKKIVEMYGGRVWAESTPGQGCTFSFTIPRPPGFDAQQHDPSR